MSQTLSPESNIESVPEACARIRSFLDEHPYDPPWWLTNRHMQTVWSTYMRRDVFLPFQRERLDTPDDDFLDVYHLEGDPAMPRAVLLHGLEGHAKSKYIGGVCTQLLAHGWNATILEFRTCGGEMNRARRTYHIGETTDLAHVVDTLIERNPEQSLYFSGVSLGGNVTMKWLGENGDSIPPQVKAAAAVSCPFDLIISGPEIDRTAGGMYLYYFLPKLKKKALAKAEQYPDALDVEAVRNSKNFKEFDTYVTAALHGFEDAEDYWRRNSCGQFLTGIRRPAMILAAADDPFNPGITIPHSTFSENPLIIPQITEKGGHVGFIYGTHPLVQRYWAEDQVVRFFLRTEEELGLPKNK